MIKEKIEELRERLNVMFTSDNIDYHETLMVSQELDVLIVEYLKETCELAVQI